MATVAYSRHGILSSLAGFGITFILLYLLSLSHQFLTRRSESQTRISVGLIGNRGEASPSDNPKEALSSLQTELQSMQQDLSVSEFSLQDLAFTPKQVDWTDSQPLDFSASSDYSTSSVAGLPEGIGLPMNSAPNALFLPSAEFPDKLIREGVVSGSAVLHLRIDTTGHCQVLKVIRISNTELQDVVVAAVEKGIFQVPRENGKAMEREVLLPITFRANEERVRLIQNNLGAP